MPELSDEPVKPAYRRAVWLAAGLLLVAAVAAWWLFARAPAAPTVRETQLTGVITGLEARLEKLRVELAALPEEAVTRQDELMRQRVPPATADGVQLSDWLARPVDSVNYAEAGEFCRRLGWVLGVPVRLPTAAECRAATGDPAFKDLAGGLAEWLAPEGSDAATAPVLTLGGTIQETPRTERSRTTGFRVVVEVDLLAAAR